MENQTTLLFSPPPGVEPNFIDPDNIAWQLYATIGAALPVALLVCGLRLYTSRWIIGRWHVDDEAKYALGRHIWDLRAEDGKMGALIEIIPQAITYNMSLATTKASILFFYLRFPSSRVFKAACYAVLALAVGNGLTAGFSFLYLCQPIRKHWDFAVPGHCVGSAVLFWVAAIVNMATDVFILLLPIWLIRPLKLAPVKMLSVLMVIMAGGFICGITIYRVVNIPKSMLNWDVTWAYVNNYMWCLIEVYVAIICACLPCLKAFAKHHFGHTWLFNPRTVRTVKEALSFVNSMTQQTGGAVNDGAPWDGNRLSVRSVSFRDLGDNQSNKSAHWTGSEEIAEVPSGERSDVLGCQRLKGLRDGPENVC
ncbi:uncharacterized protein DNG_04596 [Cephalotrichum gorgonifer]|uniref:Rhodopsin domain-containing protein n=1 Tax=Cephalotrichum gorgonifer TaxID=2041049 RepID=A0AAE8MXC8_9PEZI|nr:uncharacterized protein DNG_04596 [Cephalotrichum gorgonifer]